MLLLEQAECLWEVQYHRFLCGDTSLPAHKPIKPFPCCWADSGYCLNIHQLGEWAVLFAMCNDLRCCRRPNTGKCFQFCCVSRIEIDCAMLGTCWCCAAGLGDRKSVV